MRIAPVLRVFLALLTLVPLAAPAVVTSVQLGVAAVPENVTVQFPDGTFETVDTTGPDVAFNVLPDPLRPGVVRITLNLSGPDGDYLVADPLGNRIIEIPVADGLVQKSQMKDPEALADYLDGLLQQQRFDDYDEIWEELPEAMQEQIDAIWERQQEIYSEQLMAEAMAEDATAQAAGDAWLVNSANFFVTAALNPSQATDAQVGRGEQLLTSQEHYNQVLEPLLEERELIRIRLNDAIIERNTFQLNLDSYKQEESWWQSLDFVSDRRESFLEAGLENASDKVIVLRGELAFIDENIARIEDARSSYQDAVTLQGVKEDPALLAAEEARRFEQAVALNQELATKNAQFVEGHKQFEAQLAHIDEQIANAEANGGDHLVDGLEAERESIQETYDLWKDGMDVAIEWRGRDLQRAFSQNAADGIGPVSTPDLLSDAVRNGLDLQGELFGVDDARIAATGQSSAGIVQSARFIDPGDFSYTWGEFATDATIDYYTTWTDPITFARRYGAFWGGVGRAAKDGIYDVYVLGKGGVQLVWQAEEVALNYYFDQDSNIFGRDKLEMAGDAYDFVSELDNEKIYQLTESGKGWVARRWEMQAGSGEAGRLQALGDAGYVSSTVFGVEEVAIKGLAIGTRVGTRMLRGTGAAENVIGLGADAGRLDNAGTGFRDLPTAIDDGASRVSGGVTGSGVRVADDALPPPGAVNAPPIRGPPPTDPRTLDALVIDDPVTGKMRIRLTRSDGSSIMLTPDQQIGQGSFSVAYKAQTPNGTIVVKVTKPAEEVGDLAGEALDLFGYEALSKADPNLVEVPTIHNRYDIASGDWAGGKVTIVEQAPLSFKDAFKADPTFRAPGGDMTPGQVDAYLAGIEELNRRGYVWLDNKHDNYAFRQIGPDQWRLVIFDPGGIVPMKGLDPQSARALQRAIDNPSGVPGAMDQQWMTGGTPVGRASMQNYLAENFDHLVDWETLNAATGQNFQTLGLGMKPNSLTSLPEGLFPYNPTNGRMFSNLRQGVENLTTPSSLDGNLMGLSEPMVGQSAFTAGPTLPFDDTLTMPMDGFGSSTLFDPDITIMQPGHLVHIPANQLGNLNEVFDPSLTQFVARRFVIGSCQPEDSSGCSGATGVVAFNCPESQASSCELAFQNNPYVSFFETNAPRIELALPDDPLFMSTGSWGQGFDDQWGLKRIGFGLGNEDAWELAGEELEPVTVAVVDTGLAWGHPDLQRSSIWINRREIPGNGLDDDGNGYVDDIVGWNFVEHNNLPWDLDGHGTLVAGIIAARRNNGRGIAGVNPNSKIMVLRALDREGNSRSSFVSEAIVYAANNGARVINLSVGGQPLSRTEALAVQYAKSRGALVVAAAGNEAMDISDYGPAGLQEVLTVSATGTDDARLPVSNWGTQVNLAAPGLDILGLRAPGTDLMLKFEDPDYRPGAHVVNDAYYRATGTSFAAPLVTGVASLLLARNPELTADQVQRILLNSARDVETPGVDNLTGYGLLDARAALRADPSFFVEAQIAGVSVVQLDGKPYLRVQGTVDADRFDSAVLELGAGTSPDRWKRVAEIEEPVRGGTLQDVEPSHFGGAKEWTIRVLSRHEGGQVREARFVMNIG